MVNSQARRLVPGSNFSRFVQALINVSCTRSSASEPLWLSDQAKARSAGISATTSSRQLDVAVMAPSICPDDGPVTLNLLGARSTRAHCIRSGASWADRWRTFRNFAGQETLG